MKETLTPGQEKSKSILREAKRQRKLAINVSFALAALKPVLEELATSANEWQDTPEYYAQKKNAGQKDTNPFIIDGDNEATYKKAIDFLLQRKTVGIYQIAETLLADRRSESDYPIGIARVCDKLKEIRGEK